MILKLGGALTMMRRTATGTARTRVSRRQLLAGASTAGAGLAILSAACSSGGKPSLPGGAKSSGAGQTAKQAKRGGVIRYAGDKAGSFDTQGRSFDPHVQTQGGSKSYTLFYERLLGYNLTTYAVEPELAQKWEQPSPTEYLFTLQPGVKWQNKAPVNGRLMTADDVLWSMQRAQTNDPKFYSRSLLEQVDRVEAPSGSTIRISTKGPDSSTLKRIATDNLAILSREVFEKYPKPTTAEGAVGTGAFMMKSVEEGVGAEYERNPDYWRPGLPYLDGFRTHAFPDSQTAYSAFLANQIDVMLLSGADAKSYIAKQGAGFAPTWGPDDTINSFIYPNARAKPMDDPRVTRALRLMIDHDEFISAWAEPIFGRGAHGSLFPIALSDWDLAQEEYRNQLEWKQPKDAAAKEAIALLSAAGFTKDSPLKFILISPTGQQGQTATQLLQAQWKRYSQGAVNADIKLLTQPEMDAARANRSFTYGVFGHSAGPVEPDIWLSTTYRSGGSLNFMGFSDPQVDAMIDKQRSIFDETQRKTIVKQIVLYMLEHGPSTIGAEVYFLHATQPKVRGYEQETHFLNGREYKSVWLDA